MWLKQDPVYVRACDIVGTTAQCFPVQTMVQNKDKTENHLSLE